MTSTAPSAYRADVSGRATPFSADDGGWIAVSTMVSHAARVAEDARNDLLRDAVELASEIIGEAEVERLVGRQWGDRDPAPTDAIIVLTDRMDRAGALHLAAVTLDALLAAASLSLVQQGRIMAKRARVAWKQGHLDEASDRFETIEQLGREASSEELQIRAWIGFGSLAQMRGNYPEVSRHCLRAASAADRNGFRDMARIAHSGLMIAAGIGRRFDEALHHGWAVYQASLGDPLEEVEVLENLGQVLLDCGHTAAAGAAFAAVVSRPLPVSIILPALGGLALASAGSGQTSRMEWAAREVMRIDLPHVPRYPLALALLECATALAQAGRASVSRECLDRSLYLARMHNFHEVAYRAETLDPSSCPAGAHRPTELDQCAVSVAREVSWLEPERLPEHVVLATASG